MIDSKPLVSIGMIVYNGERYIRQALDLLLAQDYENFELIISDNASTDQTQEICLRYAARDKRIRYYRNRTNMGVRWNANRVFKLSSGEYFMWAAHDDYWKPRYLRACLEAFNISEAIVLVGTECDSIDPETGKLIFTDQGLSTIGLGVSDRFKRYRLTLHGGRYVGGIFFGVYRRSALREVMPMKKVGMHLLDQLVLAEMCFQGEFVTVPKRLMVKRSGGLSRMADSLSNLARALGIDDRLSIIHKGYLLLKRTYLEREVALQRIIFHSSRLTLPEKIGIACWSLGHTSRVVIRRVLSLGYQTLAAYARRLAIRARELSSS